MAQLNIVSKIIEADKNGWSDLVNQIDEITQTLKYNEYNRQQVMAQINEWSEEVDFRLTIPKPTPTIPYQQSETVFGTEV
jgi:hypothetical protein|tara:strand:+ start:3593 stop:3832 length:240 start_codon:yes stop_codon:yes gene_type:complete